MTFAQCKQKAEHAIREGRDDDAREWLARANETRPELSPQSRIDRALVSVHIFLECIEDEMRADSPLSQYANMTQARRLREIRAELRGER